MIEEVKKLANHYFEDIVKIRRSMHQNPELSFEEYNTSLFIQNILQENKYLTPDLGGNSSTEKLTDHIIERIENHE